MNKEKKEFIATQLKNKKTHDEIRLEMISQGYGTEGFEEAYAEIVKELGVVEPKPTAYTPTSIDSTPIQDTSPATMPGVFAMLGSAIKLTMSRFRAVLAATLLTAFTAGLFILIPEEPSMYLSGAPFLVAVVGLSILGVFLSIISSTALLYILVKAEEELTYVQGLSWSFSRIGSIIWLSFIGSVIVLTSFIVLIIPGLAFAVYNLFSFIVLIKDDQRGMDAIIRSTDLVLGKFWPILGRLLFLVLVSIPFMVLLTVLSIVLASYADTVPAGELLVLISVTLVQMIFAAVSISYLIILYKSRAAAKPFFDSSQYAKLRLIFWSLFVLGLLIPAGAVVIGATLFNSLPNQFKYDFKYNYDYESLPGELDDGGESFEDFIVEKRVDTIFSAGSVYYSKIRTYEGVCSDVVIETPARCRSTENTFVIYAPLSNGKYYCRDNGGYKGYQETETNGVLSCQ